MPISEMAFTGMFSGSSLEFGVVDDDHVIPTIAPITILGDGVMLSEYRSTFISMEYNFRRRRSENLTTLWGFRWINLDEDYDYTVIAPGGPQVLAGLTEAHNNMFGLQVGAEALIYESDCLRLEGGIRAGAYWNMAAHDSALAGVPAPGVAVVVDYADEMAFHGEVEFTGVYQLTDLWWGRLGYQFMWMEGVALAPDQISAMNLATMNGIDLEGSPFYHGALAQLERRW